MDSLGTTVTSSQYCGDHSISTCIGAISTSLGMGRHAVVRAESKAKTDGSKSKLYDQYAKKILSAVKAGGGVVDLMVNRQLAHVLDDARRHSVPNYIIDRNLAKVSSSTKSDTFKSYCCEFYGRGGVGIIVKVLTDNENRAASAINAVGKKYNLKPADVNSVVYQFEEKAVLILRSVCSSSGGSSSNRNTSVTSVIDEVNILNVFIDSDIDCPYDFQRVSGDDDNAEAVLIVDKKDMFRVREAFKKRTEISTGTVVSNNNSSNSNNINGVPTPTPTGSMIEVVSSELKYIPKAGYISLGFKDKGRATATNALGYEERKEKAQYDDDDDDDGESAVIAAIQAFEELADVEAVNHNLQISKR